MDKTALAIGPYNESWIWIRAAKELGYNIIVVHPALKQGSRLRQQLEPFVEKFYSYEYHQTEEISEVCKKHDVQMLLCLPGPNFVVEAVAKINSIMKYPGIKENASELCSNKLNFHNLLEKHDLPRPGYSHRITEQLSVSHNMFPCIVKPAFGAGGMGVEKIDNFQQWDDFIKNTWRPQTGEKNNFYIVQDFTEAPYHGGFNCVVENGELRILSHNVRNLSEEIWQPFFQENIFPGMDQNFLSAFNLRTLKKMAKVTGIDNWPLKIEVFFNENKEIQSIIEVNPRPGGTRSPLAFTKILGFDYAKEQIKLISPFHTPCFEPHLPIEGEFLMIKNFKFNPGPVKEIYWFERTAQVVSFYTELEPGFVIPEKWDVKTAQACGELILVGHSHDQLRRLCSRLFSQIKIIYET